MSFSADASQELGSIKMVIWQQHTATKLFVNLSVIKAQKAVKEILVKEY